MFLVSAETLSNNTKFVTTPFKTIHTHKLHKFPFRKSFEPAENLCDIEEDEVLDNDDEVRPAPKMPSCCLASLCFEPECEKFDLFFAAVPDQNATIPDVKVWLKMWFVATGTFINDPRIDHFLASVAMDGHALHDIKNFSWIECLLRNSNYNTNDNSKVWFAQDVVVSLAKYVFYAKEHAKKS